MESEAEQSSMEVIHTIFLSSFNAFIFVAFYLTKTMVFQQNMESGAEQSSMEVADLDSPYRHSLSIVEYVFYVASIISLFFLSDPGVPGVRSMGPDVSHSLTDVFET